MKTLRKEIRLAMMHGPMADVEDRVYEAVRTFIADKFCHSVLIVDEPARSILHTLFDRIVADEPSTEELLPE